MKPPWDIKKIDIEFGDDSWMKVQIFNDEFFEIEFLNADLSGCPVGLTAVACEEINLEVARKLRDFLNYALK